MCRILCLPSESVNEPAHTPYSRLTFWSRHWLAWTTFYLVVAAAVLGANPFKETVGPFDLLTAYSGFGALTTFSQVRHRERSDVLDFVLPHWLEARRQIHRGEIPLWNPLVAGGEPLVLLPPTMIMTPAFVVFAASPDPAFGFYLSVLVNLCLAGLGAHLLASRYCRPLAAAFAGCTFMLCGFMASWLYWPQVSTALWIPWLLLAIDTYARNQTYSKFAAIGVTTAMMFLGGFPFVVALGLGAALLWILVLATTDSPNRTRASAGAALGIVVGLAIVAVPLITLADWLKEVDISYRRGGTGFRLLEDYIRMFTPYVDGQPRVASTMYAGLLGILLAAYAAFTLPREPRQSIVLPILGLLLTAVGVVLTFGLLPHSLGAILPVLNNNPWSRAILLLNLGIALAGAAALNRLMEDFRVWRMGLIVAAGVLLFQLADLTRLFNKFNGPVARTLFFPETTLIARVRSMSETWQYTIADRTYMVSGVLGAYGIPEWFAHGLRNSELKAVLSTIASDALTTQTASALRFANIDFESPLLHAFAICFALYDTGDSIGNGGADIRTEGEERRAGPPSTGGRFTQEFVVSDDGLEMIAVAIRFATYRRDDLDGTITWSLFRADDNEPLATQSTPAAAVRDNRLYTFRLPDAVHLGPGTYRYALEYMPGGRRLPLTVWTFRRPAVAGGLSVDGKPLLGAIDHVIFHATGERSRSGAFSPIATEALTTLSMNRDCAGGPYLSKDGERPVPRSIEGSVQATLQRPTRFTVLVESAEPGYLVVPMRWSQEWTATIDGRLTEVELGYGVLPAVAVDGSHQLSFEYRPRALRVGGVITVGTLLLVMFFALWQRRSKSKAAVVITTSG